MLWEVKNDTDQKSIRPGDMWWLFQKGNEDRAEPGMKWGLHERGGNEETVHNFEKGGYDI